MKTTFVQACAYKTQQPLILLIMLTLTSACGGTKSGPGDQNPAVDDGSILGDAALDVAVSDQTVADAGSDALLADADGAAGTDALAGTDAVALDATDADAADVAAGTDAEGSTDTASGSDAEAGTDAEIGTDTVVGPDVDAGADATGGSDGTADAVADIAPSGDVVAPVVGSASIQVVDAAGAPVAGAKVTIGGKEVAVDAKGFASFSDLPVGTAIAAIAATGYAPAARSLTIIDGAQTSAVVSLVQIGATQVVLMMAGTTTNLTAGQVSLALPADEFIGANGQVFNGNVTVNVTPLDPTAGSLSGAPGPLVGTATGASSPAPLSVAFLADVSFAAPDGSPLQLAAGKTATLSFILPDSTASQYAVGQTLGAWYFDLASAGWVQDGSGTITVDGATGKKAFTAQVGHFTWWMGAEPISSTGCLAVTVTKGGAPLAGVQILAEGVSYSSTSQGTTGSGGSVCLEVKAGGTVVLKTQDAVLVQSGGPLTVTADMTVLTCGAGAGCKAVELKVLGASACANAAACDDLNPCTTDTCSAAGTCAHSFANAATCSDGSACTVNDTCLAGACIGATKNCDDLNPCTTDFCDVSDNGCANNAVPGAPACDDGDACSNDDKCTNGVCNGTDLTCDDGNPCTGDNCDSGDGCVNTPLDANASCNDNNACTTSDICVANVCTGGAIDCDDGNPCTTDSCDPASGCVHVNLPDATTCDDGQICTIQDACTAGKCGGKFNTCDDANACTEDSACDATTGCAHTPMPAQCDDGNACTHEDMCGPDGTCAGFLPSSDCNAADPCTLGKCDPKQGCVYGPKAEGASCINDACLTGQTCQTGKCSGGVAADCNDKDDCTTDVCVAYVGCTNAPKNCSDADPCTPDSCSGAGICTHGAPAAGAACEDGNPCTVGDSCDANGSCITSGKKKDCDDGSVCTVDACDATAGCTHTAANDGMACTGYTLCESGTCQGGECPTQQFLCVGPCGDGMCEPMENATNCPADCLTTPFACKGKAPGSPCSDGLFCTTNDHCEPNGLCLAFEKVGLCDDGDACTADKCGGPTMDKNGCWNPKLDCEDWDICTDDSCGATGCIHVNNTAPCNDGDACTVGDACKDAACVGGAKDLCDDSNPCTTDSCNSSSGCVHATLADGTTCDDAVACTSGEKCTSGTCSGTLKDAACDDTNTCTVDACTPSGCTHTAKTCDDGDKCTVDTCDVALGCVNKAKNCEDGNSCTTNWCSASTGNCAKTIVADMSACDDGNKCQGDADICMGGNCKMNGKITICPSQNPCTAPTCDPATAQCNYPAVADGTVCGGVADVCNPYSTCQTGDCKTFSPINCDDGNACTVDTCDNIGGVGTCKTVLADPNTPCTTPNMCMNAGKCDGAGTCGPETPATYCDDGNPCTADSCDPAAPPFTSPCTNTPIPGCF